jgi:hypothetical protein
MIYDVEMILSSQSFLYLLQVVFYKLDDLATSKTSQMTMMSLPIYGFIVHMAVFVPDFLDQTAFHDQRDIAINGGL